jgi:hypothetical protein
MLLECPIRAPHPQMGRSDWTLLTTSVSQLASSDMYMTIGQVQEYSVQYFYEVELLSSEGENTGLKGWILFTTLPTALIRSG